MHPSRVNTHFMISTKILSAPNRLACHASMRPDRRAVSWLGAGRAPPGVTTGTNPTTAPIATDKPDQTTMPKPSQARAQLLNNVFSGILRGHSLHPGDRTGVAVSAGADSVALLRLLLELQSKLGIVLSVVHFNHQFRGKASDADEKFVAGLAAKHKLPFYAGRENVAAKARREKANLEDTARRARYDYFSQLVDEGKLTHVAVAHTADDQAETVLAHILRGTGLAGLGGIHPTSGHILRPLLQIRRSDLRAYLKALKQPWREDATNRDTTKMRARIRARLLPLLEKQFQPAVVEHLAALADLAREDEAYLDSAATTQTILLLDKQADSAAIDVCALLASSQLPHPLVSNSADLAWPPPQSKSISRRIVRRIVQQLKPRAGQLNAQHVQKVLDLAEHGENGKRLPLPGGIEVCRDHQQLFFSAKSGKPGKPEAETPKIFAKKIDFAGPETHIEVPCLACVFRFTIIDWPAKTAETSISGSVLDHHALRAPLVLRSWRPGDRFQPSGHRKAHKLKRLLNEKRVSRWERDGWPVLVSGGVLAWARGFPVAAEFAANESTKVGFVIAEEKVS